MPCRPSPFRALLWLAGAALTACGASGSSGSGALQPAHAPIRSDRISVREFSDRPKLTLVERLGDPNPALALAFAHDLGSEASVALSILFEERLKQRGYPTVERQAHALGFQLATLVSGPEDAARFVLAARAALDASVSQRDTALPRIQKELELLPDARATGVGASQAGRCSGELMRLPEATKIDVTTKDGLRLLEGWRGALVDRSHVGVAALGPQPVLDRVLSTHERAPSWSDGDPVDDPWPERDATSIATEAHTRPTVTVALRIADASQAIQAATELGNPHSRLKEQLGALLPAWSLSRSIATARVRGACLRLDIDLHEGAPSKLEEVARVAFLAQREAERALASAKSDSFVLDQRILMAADPRRAAALGAWRAVTSRQPTGPVRRAVHVRTRPNLSSKAAKRLEGLLTQYRKGVARDLQRAVRVEPGQGEVWMLLGSRCGTLNETAATAGHSALLMQALAQHANSNEGVTIEPWVAPHAVGLLAHAPRLGVDETPEQHAARVGRALAEAISLTPVTFEDTAIAREQLLNRIGPEPRTAWWQAVTALSPEHPSWLAPGGTFETISEATRTNLEQRRQMLLGEPLRAVVIATRDEPQGNAALNELAHWLAPMRGAALECTRAAPAEAQLGQIEVQSAATETEAFVAVRTPADATAARATQYLLNRKGGWLDQALAVPGMVTHAEAHWLGGPANHALIVEVRALDEKTPQAVAQVRALLERLAQGASSAHDVSLAQKRLDAEATLTRLNPRGRLVALWGMPETDATLTLQRLRAFQRSLGGSHHLVVTRKDTQ